MTDTCPAERIQWDITVDKNEKYCPKIRITTSRGWLLSFQLPLSFHVGKTYHLRSHWPSHYSCPHHCKKVKHYRRWRTGRPLAPGKVHWTYVQEVSHISKNWNCSRKILVFWTYACHCKRPRLVESVLSSLVQRFCSGSLVCTISSLATELSHWP